MIDFKHIEKVTNTKFTEQDKIDLLEFDKKISKFSLYYINLITLEWDCYCWKFSLLTINNSSLFNIEYYHKYFLYIDLFFKKFKIFDKDE